MPPCWWVCRTQASSAWRFSSPIGGGTGPSPTTRPTWRPVVMAHLAGQVGVPVEALDGYDWAGRTGRRHRRIVLDHLAVSSFDARAVGDLRGWLEGEVLPREPSAAVLEQEVGAWFARGRVLRPGRHRLDRIVRSARAAHDDAALRRVADRLDAQARGRLDALLTDEGNGAAFTRLAADPGRVGLESLMTELDKLARVRALEAAGRPSGGPASIPGQAVPPPGRGRDGLGAAPPPRPHPPAAAGPVLRAAGRERSSMAWSSC